MDVALRNQYLDQQGQPMLIPISANGLLAQQNLFERLKFAFAVAPLRTKRAFKRVGINLQDPSELATIAELGYRGLDKRGIQMSDSKIYAFSVEDIVKKILADPEPGAQSLLANAPIQWVP